jgi:hypothetical protein
VLLARGSSDQMRTPCRVASIMLTLTAPKVLEIVAQARTEVRFRRRRS